MFGPRFSRIFASRWAALWWAAGILLLAWQIAGPDEVDPAQQAASRNAVDPWGIDPR